MADQPSFWETPDDEVEQAKIDIRHLHELIDDTSAELSKLNTLLGPSDRASRDIKAAIARTHGQVWGRPIKFSLAGASARAPLFEQLTQLCDQWGKMRNERAERGKTLAGYQREVKRFVSIIKAAQRRKQRKPRK
jgi:hypothetical protein